MEGAVLVVAARWNRRRPTRMEMHQAREEETVDAYNAGIRSRTWTDTNLLAGYAVALEQLHGLYRRFHFRHDPPAGAYGDELH